MKHSRLLAAVITAATVTLTPVAILTPPAVAAPCSNCDPGGGGGGGGTGGGGGGSYIFVPIRLTCLDIEDWWPDTRDEINLYYGKQTFTDPAVWAGKVDTNLPTWRFTGATLGLDLWEMDNGWLNSNHLGQSYVTSTDLGQEHTVRVSGPGYAYDLVYKVIRG